MEKKPLDLDPEVERNFIKAIRAALQKGWRPKKWEKAPPRGVYYIKKAMELEGIPCGEI